MTKLHAKFASVCAVTLMLSAGAFAEGDATRGETIFKQCATCHSMDPAEKKMGPHLQGLVGRTAGSIEGATYSKAMKASEIVWDANSLREFLTNPRKALPGTSMPIGLAKTGDMDDLLAYLSADTSAE